MHGTGVKTKQNHTSDITYNLIEDVRPAILQLTKQGVSDSFLETFPLIVMYLHVILDPNAYNLCP